MRAAAGDVHRQTEGTKWDDGFYARHIVKLYDNSPEKERHSAEK